MTLVEPGRPMTRPNGSHQDARLPSSASVQGHQSVGIFYNPHESCFAMVTNDLNQLKTIALA